jgi:hypothetical protein
MVNNATDVMRRKFPSHSRQTVLTLDYEWSLFIYLCVYFSVVPSRIGLPAVIY